MKNGKIAKNGRKVKAIIALLFCCFAQWEKVAKNGRKVKAIALRKKMDEKLRLYIVKDEK